MVGTLLTDKQKAELALMLDKCNRPKKVWRFFSHKYNLKRTDQKPGINSIKRWLKNLKETGNVNGGETSKSKTGKFLLSTCSDKFYPLEACKFRFYYIYLISFLFDTSEKTSSSSSNTS